MPSYLSEPARRILIVDDELPMQDLLQVYLHSEGFQTRTASNGLEALEKIKEDEFDLILLDLMLPGMDGFDICKAVREISTVPIIMLTAREGTVDKVVGLKMGADDYITKPFEAREMLARMEAIFRRQHFQEKQRRRSDRQEAGVTLFFKGLQLNLRTHQAYLDDQELLFTPKEFAILKLFLSNKGRIFHREDILGMLWGDRQINDDRTVDTHIKNIREKLTKGGLKGSDVIKTIWGTGYICHDTKQAE
ncbi:response regulator transcription factor [Paenibacillus albicereus]|uniref:Response regulator transcription factor n=1 Tax=Paenibacillus albicereus TaxID=2726185 RepID=A0A6H2GY76_9BACL|nr:response regulator transcription factor [Paenibacillus albicereus]QJC52342.1 response regulator transcription factor [Paenibacillus albicereus]